MPRKNSSILTDLSTGDLKRLLAARERIDVLESERQRLVKELGRVEKELGRLLAGGTPAVAKAGKKAKAVKKKRGRKKVAARKAAGARKTGTKRAGGKKVVGKKVGRKKTSARKGAARVKLEDVVLGVLKKNGAPMNFKELFSTIVDGKLFRSKSKNFDNVLRRTLSTSKLIKRVSRGVYDAA